MKQKTMQSAEAALIPSIRKQICQYPREQPQRSLSRVKDLNTEDAEDDEECAAYEDDVPNGLQR